MKKISNLDQLKAEQELLKQQQIELELAMQDDWLAIKSSLRPMNITSQVLSAVLSKPKPGESKSMLTNLVPFIAAGVMGKFIATIKKKLKGLFTKK